ncbi:mitochondrial inner membrane protein OXA1L-like isoform X2 [Macrosteles quadrilineatus]|uniref:mitochondrial inner membrane protein OXA1L-like isoform X2 n=1 Tax=Macrosteles quadrilineatus TaxID=74068 RepID=UPI0023E1ADB9|nr:mitochondrial inner membrane protein OXA1L-like isoform X2 [Macrosteles quadrilineatus]
MFSRPSLMKHTLKPSLHFLKVDSAAHLHVCCLRNLKLPSRTNEVRLLNGYVSSSFGSILQARHESTTSSKVTEKSNERLAELDPIPEPPTAVTSSAPSDITSSVQLQGELSSESGYVSALDSLPDPPAVNSPVSMLEGYGHETPFSELGLGGWTPPGMVQTCLEYFHVDLGLPWWQAVVAGTILIRLMLFPIVIASQRNIAILNNNMPQMTHIQAKVTEARQRGDKLETARYTGELMKFMQEKNVNPFKNMLPPLVQAPIFISVFMGMRKMANLPVESLKTGGTLWFTDLTVPDQFYMLPIITSATLFCTVKIGAEGTPSTSQNSHLLKYLMMGLPLIVFPFTISFPGLMLVYWTTSNFLSLVQVGILRIPRVREFFKIEQLVKHTPTNLAIKDKGFVGNVKESWNNFKITTELQERERMDRMAFMKAGRDPIKKTYKYDPTKVKPTIQAKKAT